MTPTAVATTMAFVLLSTLVGRRAAVEVIFSPLAMLRLVEIEKHFLRSLEDYMTTAKQQLDHLSRLTDTAQQMLDAQHEHSQNQQRVTDTVQHPINAFRLVHRFRTVWNGLDPLLNMSHYDELHVMVDGLWRMSYSKDEDCADALTSLIRLQEVYQLDAKSLARGSVGPFGQMAPPMSRRDCRYLAIVAMKQGLYQVALDWLKQATHLTPKSNKKQRTAIKRLRKLARAGITATIKNAFDMSDGVFADMPNLSVSYYDGDEIDEDVQTESDGECDSENSEASAQDDYEDDFPYVIRRPNSFDNHRNQLCSNSQEVMETGLLCKYHVTSTAPPYWRWKQEIVNSNPFITLYYDFLTDSEIKGLIDSTTSRMHTSSTVKKGHDDKHNRVGITANLDVNESQWFDQRCQLVTGLECSYPKADELQVSSYGLAGHYAPHYDWYSEDEYGRTNSLYDDDEFLYGDRTATLMVYLTDVVAGGSTVFPNLGVAIKPVKGAAVFWYNLHDDGSPDDRTLHSGCPVLYGEKTIATKWIREAGQFNRRLCKPRRQRS